MNKTRDIIFFKGHRFALVWCSIFLLLQFLGTTVTLYGVSMGYVESNPLMRSMIDWGMFVPLKVAVSVAGVAAVIILQMAKSRLCKFVVPILLMLPWVYAVAANIIMLWNRNFFLTLINDMVSYYG